MHYKIFFSAAALATLLSLSVSHSAYSDPVGIVDSEESSYYVRLQYNGEILPYKTKIDGFEAKKNSAVTTDAYTSSFISGGGAFGYRMDEFRVDFEGLYSQLNKADGVIFQKLNTAATPVGDGTDVDLDDSLTAIAGLVNVYYDLALDDMPMTPYVGVGVGAAYINNPLKTAVSGDKDSGFGFAYQAKAGVSYDVSPEFKLFAGARYFGAYGANFDKAAANDKGVKVLYSTIGAEVGVTFNFA
ncbi:acyloxyacyl hydrolase [Wolbachia endosymbiont of Ctenocephalides felis wCfeT]|uniref:acyloxyacyl hydrolase n=1 Tax=Wolbachia endosymbiont of Ctenocephalides felis wCfeT TaxID=2732593 RepID=UPI001446094D|nr:P44/Msp2 family outer membrane protein [Wolbachia endosymbiont of Ctenocephalides felis wCfeT]